MDNDQYSDFRIIHVFMTRGWVPSYRENIRKNNDDEYEIVRMTSRVTKRPRVETHLRPLFASHLTARPFSQEPTQRLFILMRIKMRTPTGNVKWFRHTRALRHHHRKSHNLIRIPLVSTTQP